MNADTQTAALRKKLLIASALLLAVAVASNLYLSYLWIAVNGPQHGSISSFCSISEDVDCVSVAESKYSSILGIPNAIYGVEFYGLALGVVLLVWLGIVRLHVWDSLLFWGLLFTLPVPVALAWISTTKIHSVCILCTTLYGVHAVLLIGLLLAHRRRLRAFLGEGPQEVAHALRQRHTRLVILGLAALGISQVFWLPPLLSQQRAMATEQGSGVFEGIPARGLTLGADDAPIQIVEFSDFRCPMCRQGHRTMIELVRQFPKQVRFEHRDYPLDMACNPVIKRPFHVEACEAAYYARCSARFDKFWPYAELLFNNQRQLETSSLQVYAREVGLDPVAISQCVQGEGLRREVAADIAEGIGRGIRGTPTFYINGEEVSGAKDFTFWSDKINRLLNHRP